MKKKDWIMLGLQGLGMIMVVIAFCVPYIVETMKIAGNYVTEEVLIFDDIFIGEYATTLAQTAFAFGIITLALTAATFTLSVLSKLNILKTKLPEIILGCLTVACAIVAIATLGANCTDIANTIKVFYKDLIVMPHAGGYLLAVGGLLTGVPAILGLLSLKKRAK